MRRTLLVAALALVASAPLPALAKDGGWADQTLERAKDAAAAVTAQEPTRFPARTGGLIEQAKDAMLRAKVH